MTPPRVTDKHRKQLAQGLAAAVTARYLLAKRSAQSSLGQSSDPVVTVAAAKAIHDFAVDRAQRAQNGVNARLARALKDLPTDAPPSARRQALLDARRAMDQYNGDHLAPWMDQWAENRGRADAYAETPARDGSGRSLRDSVPWTWEQLTDYQDRCTDAAEASPAPYDVLVALAGGPPQTHDGCRCLLFPAE